MGAAGLQVSPTVLSLWKTVAMKEASEWGKRERKDSGLTAQTGWGPGSGVEGLIHSLTPLS